MINKAGSDWRYDSSESATTARRPYLTVAYTLPVAPVVTPSGGSASFTESAAAVAVDPALVLTDADSTLLDGASVQITTGHAAAEDVLAFSDQNGITGSWNSATGTLTLSGQASLADYQAALRSVTYANTSESPSTTTRTLAFTATDAYSGLTSATATRSLVVTALNDAPTLVIGTALSLSDTDEDTPSFEVMVHTLLSAAGQADVDGAGLGLALTGVSGTGQWQYSTDGLAWTSVGSVQANQALLLDGNARLRFVPGGDNADVAGFTFRAWDQTSGSASTAGAPVTADPGAGGGSSAFSTGSASASRNVTAVNDAPVLADTALSLTVVEDAGPPAGAVGALVSAFTGGLSDVDSGAVKGIAITATDETHGTWHFSTDNGSTWQAVGAVSNPGSALLLADDGNTRLYFEPAADWDSHRRQRADPARLGPAPAAPPAAGWTPPAPGAAARSRPPPMWWRSPPPRSTTCRSAMHRPA